MSDLGYGPTAGWSGSDTSRERAEADALSGAAEARRAYVQGLVEQAGAWGLTIAELRSLVPQFHHGTLSSALSSLHKTGRIERLADRRGRCKVYVGRSEVRGRPTEAQGRHQQPSVGPLSPLEAEALVQSLERARQAWGAHLQVVTWDSPQAFLRFWGAISRITTKA